MSRAAATVWLLTAAVLLLAVPATAKDKSPPPSAGELWQDYPLNQGSSPNGASPTASVTPAPTAAATPAPARTAAPPRHEHTSSGVSAGLLGFFAADAAALLLLAAFLIRRRRGHSAQTAGEPRRTGKRAPLRPPPDAARPWTAEIEWRAVGEDARFCVVAKGRPASEGVVLAESAPLDWPPRGADDIQELAAAADRLAATFTDAGWKPLPSGEAWYAKRFAWDPAAVTRDPSGAPDGRRGARFQRGHPWPERTAESWRCEVEWSPGYGRARFQAVMYAPGAARGRAIGASRAFGWMQLDTPDPQVPAHQAEVHDLVTALEAAGWERVGQGAHWYSERFAWRGGTPPPDRLEPQPASAERPS